MVNEEDLKEDSELKENKKEDVVGSITLSTSFCVQKKCRYISLQSKVQNAARALTEKKLLQSLRHCKCKVLKQDALTKTEIHIYSI